MSQPLSLHDLQMIHAEMCLVWSMDPKDSEFWESWTSDETPPWNPTWNDFMEELPSRMFDPCYSLVFPFRRDLPSDWLPQEWCIPLKVEHMKKIKGVIDIMEADNEAFAQNPETLVNFSNHLGIDMSIPLDEALDVSVEDEDDAIFARIHNLEPRELFRDTPDSREGSDALADCSRGLTIIEECMASGETINEGQYLELANIFKRLAV
jgi:hypothetical protein